MNHIIKVVQFYKQLKENDIKVITNLIDFSKKSNYYIEHKTIIIENIIFLICDNITQNADCPYCFKNIYNNYLTYIPLHLNDCHFYLKPSKLQIFNNHLEINDLIHERVQISDKTFIIMREFITLFPSFMIIYTESEHHRFEAGLIDSPILQQDASIYLEDIYLVDWYITTFLIKDYNFENIIEQYKILQKKFKQTISTLILFKRNNKYYLYIILKNTKYNISTYETMGYFLLSLQHQSLNIEINSAKNTLKNGRIF